MARKQPHKVGDIVKFRAPPDSRFNRTGTWIDLDDNIVEAGEMGMIVSIREENIDGDDFTVYDIMLPTSGIVTTGWDDDAFELITKK